MKVDRTLDVGECLIILTNPDIFDSISEDGATFDDLKVDVLKDIWLRVVVDDQLIGVVQFRHVFSKAYESHIHILTEHRKAYSKLAAESILNWCSEYISGSTLFAYVPEFCGNVKRFLLRHGFEDTGTIPKAWLKAGKLNDMTILSRGV